MTEPDDRDDLRARLRAADPARSTEPSSDRWIAELTEAVMSTSPTPRPRPRRLWAVPAAAAAVLAVVGLGYLLGGGPEDPGPQAGSLGSAPTPATPGRQAGEQPDPSIGGSTTEPDEQPSLRPAPTEDGLTLRAGGLVAGRCLPVSAEGLERMPTAFEGIVTSVDGDRATLHVMRWYAGGVLSETSTVTVTNLSPELRELVAGVDLRQGGRYLVTATRGQVSACGFSATWTPRLASLYAQAYGG